MTTETQTLELDRIRIDGGTQPRVAIDEQVVAEYAEAYGGGVALPPVTVFFDGVVYWLADGFHRYWASRKIESERIAADIRQGTLRDAILYSVGANADHGLRRSNPDKRKAVLTMLEDEEWSQWSDREIAKRCGVDHKTVGAARQSLTGEIPQSQPSRTYKTKHGTIARMKTGNINRSNGSGRSRKPAATISPTASMPVRQAGEFKPRVNIDIPHDANAAARVIRSVLGDEFARQLIDELNSLLHS